MRDSNEFAFLNSSVAGACPDSVAFKTEGSTLRQCDWRAPVDQRWKRQSARGYRLQKDNAKTGLSPTSILRWFTKAEHSMRAS